jgi:peptidoglycan-associated lipoprotein
MATAPAKPPAPPSPPTAPNAAPTPRALSEEELFARKSLDELNKEQPLGDVFFDLDQSVIKDEGRSALNTNAAWLKRWSNTRISIEGHCDERGTAEYNLGLGERRANAVKAYLVDLGVAGDRITVVSKGKETPFCMESNESCWQQNRRGHFVITAK